MSSIVGAPDGAQQAAGGTSENPNFGHYDSIKNLKTVFFKGMGGQIFAAGLPPHTPVRTHTPVSRYRPSPPRAFSLFVHTASV